MRDSENIAAFLNFLRNAQSLYNIARDELHQADNETQDILHQLELHENSYHKIAALGKKLRAVRRRRRTAKDTVEIYEPIIVWANRQDNRELLKRLEQLLGEVRKIEESKENRMYVPKTKILEDKEDDERGIQEPGVHRPAGIRGL